jgi:hypothetical protein
VAKTIKVSRAQVLAARALIELRNREGRPVEPAIRAIAGAERVSGPPQASGSKAIPQAS